MEAIIIIVVAAIIVLVSKAVQPTAGAVRDRGLAVNSGKVRQSSVSQ